MKITGGCHCGKITYEAEVKPENIIVCHCADCQVLSGSGFRSIAMSEPDSFAFLSGTPNVYVKTGDSGNKREQTFCSDCGSPIYSTSVGDGPKQYGIRLGTVDQRDSLSPTKQIWFDSSQPWTQDMHLLPKVPKQKY